MLNKELKTVGSLPADVKSAVLALSILIDRIGSLPRADRDDLFELLQEWRKTSVPEERQSIQDAMEEVLAQMPPTTRALHPLPESPPAKVKSWAEHVGGRIKQMRLDAGLTQEQLAERAGLPQSHVSRIENAQHTATSMTLEKIAKALGVDPGRLDPCADD